MATTNLVLFYFSIACVIAVTCSASTYLVGDTSGWDISTDLDSWAMAKTFSVGDVLVFQYSSTHSVYEVKKDNYRSCNTTNALQTYASGNTTVTLSKPGDKFFVCGNRLHCLSGMKLHVNVDGDESPAPVGAPQAQPGGGSVGAVAELPRPSSKKNNPATAVPNSSGGGFERGGGGGIFGIVSLVLVVCNALWNV